MNKNKKKKIKLLSILILCTLIFTIPSLLNLGFINLGFINKNLRASQEYESAGLIALWSGPLNTIPAGWKLCDGSAGTIDTTNLFVYSTGSMEVPGATGGSTTHDHSYSTVPSHDHGVSSTTSTPHYHGYTASTTSISVGSNGLLTHSALGWYSATSGGSSASHNHGGYTSYTGIAGDCYTSEEEDIIPPYYEILFIEKEAGDTAIPIGLIVMWAGDIGSIPAGWELCNGSNGTPDLREQYLMGAPPGEDPGTLGGTIAHDHTYTQIPQHRHTIDSGGASHTHGYYGTTRTVSYDLFVDRRVYLPSSSYSHYASYSHSHSVPTIGSATCTTEDTDNLPPYFKLAFIMSTIATDGLPLGAISMWGDSIANIPPGWYQCNGTSGTPDMLNRFPRGVATGEQPGLVGGSTTHRHVYTEVPQHTHTIPTDPMNHRHSMTIDGGNDRAITGSVSCDKYTTQTTFTSDYPSPTPSHNHDINPDGSATCYTSYENSLPPYVKLIYMQKGQSFISPSPANGATHIIYNPLLTVYVNDLEGDDLNVSFYDASDDSLIGWDYVFGGVGSASVIWSALSDSTVYMWYIKTDDGVIVAQSPTWSFTTNYAPGLPTNPTPGDGSTDINFNPTLMVDVFDNDGDIMNVSFYDASDDSMIGWEFIFGGSGTASATWSGLTNDTIFSWYAKADDMLSVVQSPTWAFTTNYAPGVPVNPMPQHWATRLNYSPTLRVDVFDNDGDDLTVSFYDASDDSLIDSELVLGGIGNASVVWSGLLPGHNYTWYTISDDGLNIRQSPTWIFFTNHAPDAPINPTPNNGATGIGDDPVLTADVFDFEGDVLIVSFYDASDDSLIDSELVLGGNGTASVFWPGLSSQTIFSWYATADDGLSVIQSATWSFTTAIWALNHAPNAPINPSPNDGASSIGDNPTLTVDVIDVDGDNLIMTFYNASDNSVIGQDTVTGGSGTASVTWSGVTGDINCHWYVIANDGEAATQSVTWSFRTGEAPPPPGDYTTIIIVSAVSAGAVIGVVSIYGIMRRKMRRKD